MKIRIALLTMLVVTSPAGAQGQTGLAAACAEVDQRLQMTCRVAAQAVESAQPQVGILVTGGNPTIGTASTGGLRLGLLPRMSATVKANLVRARVPDLREIHSAPNDDQSYGDLGILAPSLSGTASLGIFSGVSLAPTVGGIGSIDLLGAAAWLPLRLLGSEDFRAESADFSYGGGLRIGLIRESFTMPGASISVMHHRLGSVSYGEICPNGFAVSSTEGSGYTLEEGECLPLDGGVLDYGDMGEFSFDLTSWSTRAAVSKHLLGLGVAAGIGYDRYSSDIEAGIRAPQGGFSEPGNAYARIRAAELSQDRWSGFVNGSFSILIATFAAEAGWMQGDEAVTGYPASSSDFDPAEGTFFGSLGIRVAL